MRFICHTLTFSALLRCSSILFQPLIRIINTEMNYWPAEPCALPECHLPLFDHLFRMWENGRHTAREMYGCREFVSYQIELQKECEDILVPKLTITTFVENACIHGIEMKTAPGWIFVRVYLEEQNLCVEVEDTGSGIDEVDLEFLTSRMQNASINMLREKGRVGIVNTRLRIKMMTGDTAKFSVESEKGIGTVILIRIPLKKAERAE